jgi:translation initiation factor 2 beta subunit (eIF-2beta)/eIF-5
MDNIIGKYLIWIKVAMIVLLCLGSMYITYYVLNSKYELDVTKLEEKLTAADKTIFELGITNNEITKEYEAKISRLNAVDQSSEKIMKKKSEISNRIDKEKERDIKDLEAIQNNDSDIDNQRSVNLLFIRIIKNMNNMSIDQLIKDDDNEINTIPDND